MRVQIPRWEIAVICSALLFPGTSLSAQEVGQEEKEVKEMRQDVEQLQQDVIGVFKVVCQPFSPIFSVFKIFYFHSAKKNSNPLLRIGCC